MIKIVTFSLAFFLLACKTTHEIKNHQHNFPHDIIEGKIFAHTKLQAKSGSNAYGDAWFSKTPDGIKVAVLVYNVAPGDHGIHVHEKGDCSAHDASSAGAHYNPTHVSHGGPDPRKHHVGDFGNINIDANGKGVLHLSIPKEHFHKDFKDWKKIIGKSLIIHDKADDLSTQPSGDSGDRIACGVIKAK